MGQTPWFSTTMMPMGTSDKSAILRASFMTHFRMALSGMTCSPRPVLKMVNYLISHTASWLILGSGNRYSSVPSFLDRGAAAHTGRTQTIRVQSRKHILRKC